MSDPQRLQEGILPNFTHFPTQPFINGFPVHSNPQQPGNLLTHQQQPPPYYLPNPLYNPYSLPHNGQQSMTFPAHPYMGIPMPNPIYYQSLPVPPLQQSPFNDLNGSILPPIRPIYDPHIPSMPKPAGYKAEIERFRNRIVRPTRKEAAVTLQRHWRGYQARKRIRPILRLSKYAIQRENKRVEEDRTDYVCRCVAGELISQAVEVMVTNFVVDWLEYTAFLILLDLECYVIRDRIVDEVISENFTNIIYETFLEVIAEDMYRGLIEEETKDALLSTLALPRYREEMRIITMNDIQATMMGSEIMDELIFSNLVRRLDTERYDLGNSREIEGIKEDFIMNALISLLKKYDP